MSLSLQYGRFHYSPLQIFKSPQLPHFLTDLDATGIKIHGLLRSFVLNIVVIRVAVPFNACGSLHLDMIELIKFGVIMTLFSRYSQPSLL